MAEYPYVEVVEYPEVISLIDSGWNDAEPVYCVRGDFSGGMYKPIGANQMIANELYGAINANRDFFRPWLPWVDSVKSPADEMPIVESLADRTTCKYYLRLNGWLTGVVGVVREDKNTGTMEIGYWHDPRYNGHGVMTWAVGKAEMLCFLYGDAKKVEIRCATENKRSRRIPERLGYRQECILPAAEKMPSGVVHDIVVYSKTLSEWLERPTGLQKVAWILPPKSYLYQWKKYHKLKSEWEKGKQK